ncbi:MAG: SDR family oxidoreductase [Clostridiales bacterium]|nr:SDR family oxidoreductase [Clostridiales bacterium]
MKALVTGASSGIGYDIAIELSNRGYDIIAVARNKEKLENLRNKCKTNVIIIPMDLSEEENVFKLYEQVKNENIDILVNDAGFGVFGKFTDTELHRELNLIEVNIKALHILTKLFLKDMVKRDSGRILNVSSIAGMMPSGPMMSTYYASKAYVLSLTRGIDIELKKMRSNVKISVLCPGPVDTDFNDVANVKFQIKPLSSSYVAKYTVKKMFKNKLEIVPGFSIKCIRFFSKIIPSKILSNISYKMQMRKCKG